MPTRGKRQFPDENVVRINKRFQGRIGLVAILLGPVIRRRPIEVGMPKKGSFDNRVNKQIRHVLAQIMEKPLSIVALHRSTGDDHTAYRVPGCRYRSAEDICTGHPAPDRDLTASLRSQEITDGRSYFVVGVS